MSKSAKQSAKKLARRVARALVLQILYEVDMTSHNLAETLAYHMSEAEDLSPAQEQFIRKMVLGTLKYKTELDEAIQKVATEWPLDQLAPVDRNILRFAFYELTYQTKRAHQIVINEAVQLARVYGGDSAPRFVNGVLGAFVKGQLVV